MDDELLMASAKLIVHDGCSKLFTKDGVLRKPIGSAHKGWALCDFQDSDTFWPLFTKKGFHQKLKLKFYRRILRRN